MDLLKEIEFMVMNSSLTEKYKYIIDDLGDPRAKNWFPISSPTPTITFISIYLYLIYKVLPRYMKLRKPVSLDNVVRFYNILQIICCTTLVYKLVTPLAEPSYVWKCERFDYSLNERALKRLNLSYYFYWIKVIELLETIFFALRKKFSQISVLHVYHHVTTLITAWCFTKYFAGGMGAFCMMLNSSVHVIMYTYYLLTSLGPCWQERTRKWKSTLTMLQMIQLLVLIVHASQVLFLGHCNLPIIVFLLYAPNVAIMFFMFANFYRKSYVHSYKSKTK